jgi:hypothetical protein
MGGVVALGAAARYLPDPALYLPDHAAVRPRGRCAIAEIRAAISKSITALALAGDKTMMISRRRRWAGANALVHRFLGPGRI